MQHIISLGMSTWLTNGSESKALRLSHCHPPKVVLTLLMCLLVFSGERGWRDVFYHGRTLTTISLGKHIHLMLSAQTVFKMLHICGEVKTTRHLRNVTFKGNVFFKVNPTTLINQALCPH